MAKKFLHLAVKVNIDETLSQRQSEVQGVLDKAADWFRYATNCWIIYTTYDAEVWNQRLEKIPWMTKNGFFIVEIDISNRSGYLSRSAWDWIIKARND